jgi:ABC-type glycerol-3-phosphate transport system permease component
MRKYANLPLYLVLLLVILFYATPFFIILTTSFKTDTQTVTRDFQWIPNPATINQFKIVLERFPFGNWVVNSVIVSILSVLIVLAISLPAGYAFARLKFKGKNLLFSLALLTIMIPFSGYMPQLYLEMTYMKLINTYIGLVIPLSTSAVSIFLFRQFISQIPEEMDDAARIDGCSNFQIFTRIILPLTKPAMVTVIIFTAIKSWNNLMWPLIAATKDSVKTLPAGLAVNIFTATNSGAAPTPYGVVMAAALLTIAIPVLLFLFLQKYFVEGIATTGFK